jgi:hypothetical protein
VIDDAFCVFLEGWLCWIFRESDDLELHYFWCDGVYSDLSEVYYSRKYINDKRETKLKTFIGKDGQTRYDLILKFGPKSLSRYARGLDIERCLPENLHGIFIDPKNKVLIIQLY